MLENTHRTIIKTTSKFEYKHTSFKVVKAEIVNFVEVAGYIDCVDCYLKEDYLLLNCINDDALIEIDAKTEVKPGDKIYAVTAHDGDCYGQFILGIFTEEPNTDEIIRRYNEHLKNEDEYCYTEHYIGNVFEIIVE